MGVGETLSSDFGVGLGILVATGVRSWGFSDSVVGVGKAMATGLGAGSGTLVAISVRVFVSPGSSVTVSVSCVELQEGNRTQPANAANRMKDHTRPSLGSRLRSAIGFISTKPLSMTTTWVTYQPYSQASRTASESALSRSPFDSSSRTPLVMIATDRRASRSSQPMLLPKPLWPMLWLYLPEDL